MLKSTHLRPFDPDKYPKPNKFIYRLYQGSFFLGYLCPLHLLTLLNTIQLMHHLNSSNDLVRTFLRGIVQFLAWVWSYLVAICGQVIYWWAASFLHQMSFSSRSLYDHLAWNSCGRILLWSKCLQHHPLWSVLAVDWLFDLHTKQAVRQWGFCHIDLHQ